MDNSKDPTGNHNLTVNDQAISLPDEDKLGRYPFAQKLARDLSRWKGKQSIVVGLNGKWGSGKSSVKNLILHALEKDGSPLEYIQFNPWLTSGEEAITKSFFDEIAQKLKTMDDSNKSERLEKWRNYTRYLALGSKLANGIEVAGLFVPGLAAAGSVGKAVIDQAEELANTAAESLEARELSLTSMKAELTKTFRDLPKPILVVIDDIDRLTKEEIRLVVQLIKSNVDFPNITYLLLYQRSTVTRALNGVHDEDGYQYLQKIVQIDLDIPSPRPLKLREFLVDVIKPCFDRTNMRGWDRSRWDEVATRILWPLYQEPRQIIRLDCMLNFHLEAHSTNGWLNVNFMDLILLESLRIHYPEVYQETSRGFSRGEDPAVAAYYSSDESTQRLRHGIEEQCEKLKAHPKRQAILGALLHELFPQANQHFKHSGTIEQKWLRELRLCHPKHFPKYFHLTMEPEEIPVEDITRLLSEKTNPKEIRTILEPKFSKRASFDELMDYFRALKEEIPQSMIPILIQELFELSDSLPSNDNTENFDTGGLWTLCEIVHLMLNQVPEQLERDEIILGYRQDATVLNGIIFYLERYANNDPEKQTYSYLLTDKILLSQSAIDQAKSEIATQLQRKAETGELLRNLNATAFLDALGKWGENEKVKHWARSLIQQPEDLLLFFEALIDIGHTAGGDQSWTNYTINPKKLETFLTSSELKPIPSFETEDPLKVRIVMVIQDWISRRAEPMGDGQLFVASRDNNTGELLNRPSADMPFQ